jgi:hypothetical protein
MVHHPVREVGMNFPFGDRHEKQDTMNSLIRILAEVKDKKGSAVFTATNKARLYTRFRFLHRKEAMEFAKMFDRTEYPARYY